MNAKRLGLFLGTAVLSIVSCLPFLSNPTRVEAQGAASIHVQPVFQSEGRQRVFIGTSCISGSWNPVISSDTIARSTTLQWSNANTAPICLSSATQTGSCTSSSSGVELSSTTPTYITFSRGEWWCKSASGTQGIKGVRTRDLGDYGQIGDPTLQ